MIYMENFFKTGFICCSKFLFDALIFFDQKKDASYCFCVNHYCLNNQIIINWYLFSLIRETLNRFVYTK